MMKFERKEVVEYDVEKVRCTMNVRYWEDADVNGVEDSEGDKIPLRKGDTWDITIDLESGIIENWTKGVTASVHYKVCDAGAYQLIDYDGNVMAERDHYVPSFLAPKGGGYGDYVVINIDENGYIEDWKADSYELQDYFGDEE